MAEIVAKPHFFRIIKNKTGTVNIGNNAKFSVQKGIEIR